MSKNCSTIILKAAVVIVVFILSDLAVHAVLRKGIVQYYGLDKKAEILLVGHSQTVLGIDSEKLKTAFDTEVAKYAIAGANTLDRLWMIKHYLSINPHIRTIIYDVNAQLFDSEGLSSASYTLFLPFIDDEIMSQYLRREATWQEYYTAKIIRTARFRDQTLNIALRGIFGRIENRKDRMVRIDDHQSYLARERKRQIRINKQSLECFHETLRQASRLNVKVILVYIPVIDLLNTIDVNNQKKVIQIFEEAAESNPNVYFLDYSHEYEHRYDFFFDLRHLNERGKQALTKQLIQELRNVIV